MQKTLAVIPCQSFNVTSLIVPDRVIFVNSTDHRSDVKMRVPSGAKFMRDRSPFSSIGDWLAANLGIASILNVVSAIDRRVTAVQSSIVGIDQAIVNLSAKIAKLEKTQMTTTQDVLSAIESAKNLLLEKISAEAAEIAAKLEAAKNGASPEELQAIIDQVNNLASVAGDAVSGLVVPEVVEPPIEESPVEPAPVE